jgi:hypothetical protein
MSSTTQNSVTTSRKLSRILQLAALSVAIGAGAAFAQDAAEEAAPAPAEAQTYDAGGNPEQGPQQNFQQQGGRRGRQQQMDAQGNFQQGGGRRGQRGQQQDQFGGGGRGQRGQQQDQFGGGRGGRNRSNDEQQGWVAPPNADQFTQEFGMIPLHNIFMQRRGIPPAPTRQDMLPSTPEQLTVLTGLVEADSEGQPRAIVDDAKNNRVLHLKVGDQILNGKITAIHIGSDANDIVYQAEGKDPLTIQLGSNFLGQGGGLRGARLGAASAIAGSDFTGYNGGTFNSVSTFGRGGGFNNNGGFNGGFGGPGGGGGGGRGGRGGGFTPAPAVVVPAAPLPGDAGMSVEERMRLRRQTEGMAGAVAPVTQAPAAPAPTPAPAAAPAPAPIVDPNVAAGAGLTVEEQMRLRRMQQVGQ